ncbi:MULTISPECIES: ABC transporter permease [Microbacterium]|uniref:ABC transporter permease n=1 Tax=Microbacterium TaxID=33882 RepID=UPI002788E27E|nr:MULTISPECIES: ABC transporter permease [Microbacterium]MDQ1082023.1 ABC-2 type transport system permease protein [Microbacterium sp. SORGH_AS_0344]MDQ1169210.1 ABC-2 type transport system permease protein [Microbacterium proteolyticum]
MSTATPAPRRAPGELQSIWLVAEREIGSKLRSKAFVISTAILIIAALATVIWGGFTASNASGSGIPVAVTSQTQSAVSGLDGVEVTVADGDDAARALVEDGTVDAALVSGSSDAAFDYTVVVKDDVPSTLLQMLSETPPVQMLDPGAGAADALRYLIALGFGLVFLIAASTFGGTIAQSVVEEKQTRVVEILISAIPVRVLLAGKVLGNTILAMAQIVLLAAVAVVGLAVTDQTGVLDALGAPIAWFAIFFLFGFVLLAALFAAAAAMVSRQEDIGSTTTPITMLIMAPYFLVIFFNDNPVVLTIMSYVPFSAPVGMPLRMYIGDARWWEPVLSLLVLLAACVLAIGLAARIYRNSLLRMGARVKLAEALRG